VNATIRAALAALLLVALAGCGSAKPKLEPLPALTGPSAGRVLWRGSVGAAREFEFFPMVVGESVIASGSDGSIVRLELATGRELWRANAGNRIAAGVGGSAKLVVVGTLDGEVIALSEDGKPAWKARVTSEIVGPPLVTNELVVVRTADSRVFGLSAQDGKRRWVYQRAAPALVVRSSMGAVAAGGTVYAGFPGGKLVALAANNGGLRWEGTVSLPKGTTELERVSDVVGAPWLAEREVCAVAFQGRAACFDNNTGSPLWTKDLSSTSGLAGDARVVFVSEAKGAVVALDRSTGNSLWRQDKLAGRTLSAPLAVDQTIVVGDGQGLVHLLARETGAFVGRISTDGTPIAAPPVRIPGGFLVQTRGGALYAVSL
jgi:outer membrane protein assembly factor BamB